MKKYILSLSFNFVLFALLVAQTPVGSWRDHLCYSFVKKVIRAGDKIYCAAEQNYFIYNTADNSTEKVSTINGLSDVGVTNMAYYPEKDILLVAYLNGNIDLIHANAITNIANLKQKVISTKKSPNHILFNGDYAYCSCDFGILVIDLVKNEIKDTYNVGELGNIYSVNSLAIFDNFFYAATDKGVFKASVNDPFLVDFNRWTRQTNISLPNRKFGSIVKFQNSLVVNSIGEGLAKDTLYFLNNSVWSTVLYNDTINTPIKNITTNNNQLVVTCEGQIHVINSDFKTIYKFNKFTPQDAIIDDNNNLWIGDFGNGLMKQSITNNEFSYYYPQGPGSNEVWNMKSSGNSILVVAGGVNEIWSGLKLPGMFFRFQQNSWFNYWHKVAKDYTSVCGDPDDPDKFYVGSFGYGISVFKNNEVIKNYNDTNSTLQNFSGSDMRMGGITFDSKKNMWCGNQAVTSSISVRKYNASGNDSQTNWKGFNYSELAEVGNKMGEILCDINDNFWVIVSGGLVAFSINKTIDNIDDDANVRFAPKDAFGESISNVLCFANDKDGAVWVGTERGPVVYTDPVVVFNKQTDGFQPIISRDNGTDDADALLGSESIYSIAVDGANRKWFGTGTGGAFLMSADGTKQILHFNTENSPLFSNFVKSIAIHPVTGEVFFGTDKGIISYRNVATEPMTDLSGAYAFPNPVRPDYHGSITITGLVTNTSVKITDISGNLVYQTISQGGSAIWNGKTRRGSKAATGVYLIFLTNEDGSDTNIIKLLIAK